MIFVDGGALGIGDSFEVGHPLEADPVEVLGPGVPDDVGGGPGTGGRPILDFSDLASASVTSILEKALKLSKHRPGPNFIKVYRVA